MPNVMLDSELCMFSGLIFLSEVEVLRRFYVQQMNPKAWLSVSLQVLVNEGGVLMLTDQPPR